MTPPENPQTTSNPDRAAGGCCGPSPCSAALCQITCGAYPGYYQCGKPAKYVTDGSKPPGKLFVCGIHKRGRKVTPLPNTTMSCTAPKEKL